MKPFKAFVVRKKNDDTMELSINYFWIFLITKKCTMYLKLQLKSITFVKLKNYNKKMRQKYSDCPFPISDSLRLIFQRLGYCRMTQWCRLHHFHSRIQSDLFFRQTTNDQKKTCCSYRYRLHKATWLCEFSKDSWECIYSYWSARRA